MTVDQAVKTVKEEMAKLTFIELKLYARKMGIRTAGLTRIEIEEECVSTEQYAFTH